MEYERINLKLNGVSIQLELTDSDLIRFYRDNRERVEKYFLAYLSEAMGDIKSGEGLDGLIGEINISATKEKIALLEDIERQRNASRN